MPLNEKYARMPIRQLVSERFLVNHLHLPRVAIGGGIPPFHPYHDGIKRTCPITCRLSGSAAFALDVVSSGFGMRPSTLVAIVVTHYLRQLLYDENAVKELAEYLPEELLDPSSIE